MGSSARPEMVACNGTPCPLIGSQVGALGWFRRGIAPWMDLIQINSEGGTIINSYHRFWSFLLGGGLIILGLVCAM